MKRLKNLMRGYWLDTGAIWAATVGYLCACAMTTLLLDIEPMRTRVAVVVISAVVTLAFAALMTWLQWRTHVNAVARIRERLKPESTPEAVTEVLPLRAKTRRKWRRGTPAAQPKRAALD